MVFNLRISGAIIMVLLLAGCLSDPDYRKTGRIKGDRLVLELRRDWDPEKRHTVAGEYEIDTAILEMLLKSDKPQLPDSLPWKIDESTRSSVRISRSLIPADFESLSMNELLLFDENWIAEEEEPEESRESFGTNDFSYSMAFEYSDSVATFRLRGWQGANDVVLSGSFNGWSTMELPMRREQLPGREPGWSVSFRIDPGRYEYKFVIDGEWVIDPDNRKVIQESGRGDVSVIYIPNVTFKLRDRKDAHKVVVTGSFLDWKPDGIRMSERDGSWVVQLWLTRGTWAYKFIADGEWLTDPENKETRTDASGNLNSFISIGEEYEFRLSDHLDAKKAVLTGSFNDWDENELVMERTTDGWKLDYSLDDGNWEYKFIVDGKWMPDPANPYKTGSGNYTNSLLAYPEVHMFILEGFPEAEEVVVTGTFKDWDPSGYRMVRDGKRWVLPIYLKPGKHLYKFIVDGNWILDPANENWEDNQYGTGNSVLWIERQGK